MNGKVSVDERRRLVAESLQVGNPGNNARDLPGQRDPRSESQIEISVEEIRSYENNPRRATNAKAQRFRRRRRQCVATGLGGPAVGTASLLSDFAAAGSEA